MVSKDKGVIYYTIKKSWETVKDIETCLNFIINSKSKSRFYEYANQNCPHLPDPTPLFGKPVTHGLNLYTEILLALIFYDAIALFWKHKEMIKMQQNNVSHCTMVY